MGVVVYASVRAGAGGLALAPGSLSLQLQNGSCPPERREAVAAPRVPGARSQPPRAPSLMPPPPACSLAFYIWRSPWHPSPTLACLSCSRWWSSGWPRTIMWLINLITNTVIGA